MLHLGISKRFTERIDPILSISPVDRHPDTPRITSNSDRIPTLKRLWREFFTGSPIRANRPRPADLASHSPCSQLFFPQLILQRLEIVVALKGGKIGIEKQFCREIEPSGTRGLQTGKRLTNESAPLPDFVSVQ